jgi:DNA-binding MarR family transcriptional regulator
MLRTASWCRLVLLKLIESLRTTTDRRKKIVWLTGLGRDQLAFYEKVFGAIVQP